MSSERPLFTSSIKERVLLSKPGSSKATYHIVLDLKGSNLRYGVGDCAAILPANLHEEIEPILSHLSCSGAEKISLRGGAVERLDHFLIKGANLSKLSPKFYRLCESRIASPKKEELALWQERGRGDEAPFTLADLLKHFAPELEMQELIDHLLPQLPRYYSIASSMEEVGEELHLLVKLSQYGEGTAFRLGTCSRFLCHSTPLNQPLVPLYLDTEREFTLPKGDAPIIMVGPGTGVAPFRGFMQERLRLFPHSKNWLFFGERESAFDFYYQEFWYDLERRGLLTLDLAFSRDQQEKVYVQHLMLKKSEELWKWLQMGALLYVCGDASQMAKEVEATLQTIAMKEGRLTQEEARLYMRSLKREKRYLRDVY